jgi:hypothetical protein
MNPTKCDKCGNTEITFYRQVIAGGRVVVTARCANGHHPKTGQPFYPLCNFRLEKLPLLGQLPKSQIEMFKPQTPTTLIELVERKRNISNLFPPVRKG